MGLKIIEVGCIEMCRKKMMEEQHVITEFGFKRTQSGSACLWFWQGLVQLRSD